MRTCAALSWCAVRSDRIPWQRLRLETPRRATHTLPDALSLSEEILATAPRGRAPNQDDLRADGPQAQDGLLPPGTCPKVPECVLAGADWSRSRTDLDSPDDFLEVVRTMANEPVETKVRLISVIRGDKRVSLYGSYAGRHYRIDLPLEQWDRMVEKETQPRDELREIETRVFAKLAMNSLRQRPV